MNIKYVKKWIKKNLDKFIGKEIIVIENFDENEDISKVLRREFKLNINRIIDISNLEVYLYNKKAIDKEKKFLILLDYKKTIYCKKQLMDFGLIPKVDFWTMYEEFMERTLELRNSQVDFIIECSEKFKFNNKEVLEIGCGDGLVTKTIADLYTPKKIIGTDILEWDYKRKNTELWNERGDNWSFVEGAAENLAFPDDSFDYIISLSSFEHIANIEDTLRNIKRMLKKGGEFYTYFGPVWTSYVGHHYRYWEKKYKGMIPPWGHLYMNYEEMQLYLDSKREYSKEEIKAACEYIYKENGINRITHAEFSKLFLNSGMKVVEIVREKKYPKALGQDGFNKLLCTQEQALKGYTELDLLTYRISIILKKV